MKLGCPDAAADRWLERKAHWRKQSAIKRSKRKWKIAASSGQGANAALPCRSLADAVCQPRAADHVPAWQGSKPTKVGAGAEKHGQQKARLARHVALDFMACR